MELQVFIISCQVSLKWNTGPVITHVNTSATATQNAAPLPLACDTHLANLEYPENPTISLCRLLDCNSDHRLMCWFGARLAVLRKRHARPVMLMCNTAQNCALPHSSASACVGHCSCSMPQALV